jgi:hypothetical protein
VLQNRLRLATSAFTYLDLARAKTAGLVVSANTALELIPNLYALFGGELDTCYLTHASFVSTATEDRRHGA